MFSFCVLLFPWMVVCVLVWLIVCYTRYCLICLFCGDRLFFVLSGVDGLLAVFTWT